MIIVADSGSTKTDWRLINANSKVKELTTTGLNPLAIDANDSLRTIQESPLARWPVDQVTKVFLYGAGIIDDQSSVKVSKLLSQLFKNAQIATYSDLLGAARAAFGNQGGVIGILGTGSNSGLYDGFQIKHRIPSLGYILGDEGSGSALGKAFIKAYLRGELPEALVKKFCDLNSEIISLDKIYQGHAASYLASFAPFLLENREDSSIQDLLAAEIKKFIEVLNKYPKQEDITLVGSIAYYFKEEISHLAKAQGLQIKEVIQSPIDRLATYHLNLLT